MRALLPALLLLLIAVPSASAAPRLTQLGSFDTPVYATSPPADPDRLFVVEKAGRIVELRGGQKIEPAFLDIRADVVPDGEQGLLSMAFAPDYATSRRFYVYYTGFPRPGGGNTIKIDEFRTLPGNPSAVDPASRRTIHTVPHPSNTNHDGGQLQFGPDGALYAGTGDGGAGNDPPNNAQNPSSDLGKLLRIDINTGGVTHYASGLRNPWRFSFDRQTGDLTIADVGQNAYEEVNFTPAGTGAGVNYGWRCFEGFHRTTNSCATTTGMTPPVLEKEQSSTGFQAIVGGYVVRDPLVPSLAGRYVYGDNYAPGIRSVTLGPGRADGDAPTGLSVMGLTSFGEDSRGRVYVVDGAGPVYRIDEMAPDTQAPVLSVGGKRRQRVVRQRGARVSLLCNESCGVTLRGYARIGRSKKRYRLRTTSRQLGAGVRSRATVKVSKRLRRRIASGLRRGRSVRITVRATARDAARNASVKRKLVRARR